LNLIVKVPNNRFFLPLDLGVTHMQSQTTNTQTKNHQMFFKRKARNPSTSVQLKLPNSTKMKELPK